MAGELRNHPIRKDHKYTIQDFLKDFPSDDICLDWLMDSLYPNGVHCADCGKVTKHHKVKSRKSYSCDVCGHHVHPTADTIYHKSSTPLTLWFYAVYLMSSSRCGISAKHLQRETGVTYKTAWRMFQQIRTMVYEDVTPLEGEVEVDELMSAVAREDVGPNERPSLPVPSSVKAAWSLRRSRTCGRQLCSPL
ncbi:hypothetical protein BH11ARM2_BH11ARM2_39390 [soil metagenome]